MDCSPPGSSFYGILQARILEWVVIPFSRGSSWPRDWTLVSCTADRLSSEPPEKPMYASVELFLIHCSVILDGSQMFFSSRKISCFLFWKYPPPHMFLFPVTRAIFSQMLQSWTDICSSPLFSHISYFVIFLKFIFWSTGPIENFFADQFLISKSAILFTELSSFRVFRSFLWRRQSFLCLK